MDELYCWPAVCGSLWYAVLIAVDRSVCALLLSRLIVSYPVDD